MLNHIITTPQKPHRVVILGAKGFVGSHLLQRLEKEQITCLGLGREELDLQNPQSSSKLANILNPLDTLVVISAKAPCKNHQMFLQNIEMMKNVCDALQQKVAKQVIYISSDAVYADSMEKISEQSLAAPGSLHGVMHLAREIMLQSVLEKESLLILRPSLLYGLNDPHNGYGPNSFYRLAKANKKIELFGNGEEKRDHVYIEDVAEIIFQSIIHQSYGVMNITSGQVLSFMDVANIILKLTRSHSSIQTKPRNGPMPHNGYRAFCNSTCELKFQGFQYQSLEQGLSKMWEMDHLK